MGPTHPAITNRERMDCVGGDGRNCGYINLAYFLQHGGALSHAAIGGRELQMMASRRSLEHADFVTYWCKKGLFCGSRRRGEEKTAGQISQYHARGNKATNLTMALLAKELEKDIYIVNQDGNGTYCVTVMYADARLEEGESLGVAVSGDDAVRIFQEYEGPVLVNIGNRHWSAFRLRGREHGPRAERARVRSRHR